MSHLLNQSSYGIFSSSSRKLGIEQNVEKHSTIPLRLGYSVTATVSVTVLFMIFCDVFFILDVPPVFPPPSQLFSILLQITNNAGCQVTLISNDAKPLNGETLLPNSMLTVSKLTSHMKPIKFLAVDSATEKRLLINGVESVNVSPSTKQIMMPLVISGK